MTLARIARCLAVAGALLLGTWTVAWAHATLVSAEPAAGSHVAAAPARVRLVFSEPLEPALAHVTLVAADARATPLAVAGDPHDVHALVARLDPLPAGAYRVLWHIVSADGHPVDGSYVFWVGAPAASGPSGPPPPAVGPAAAFAPPTWGPTAAGAPLVPAALRGLALGSLMALTGLLGFTAWTPRDEGPAPAIVARRVGTLTTVLAVATPILLAAHALAWLVNASPDHRLTSDGIGAALATSVGRTEVWRTGLALLALWASGLARRPRLALVFALGALLASGATGHASAIDPAWATPAKALHLVAGAAWLGGLLWLLARDGDARAARRVSTVALIAVLVVALSGLVQTILFLPSPRDLVRTAYGAVALAKVAGLLVLVAFGAYQRYRVLPRLADATRDRGADVDARLATTLRREIAVMAVVILLGGLLAYMSPRASATGPDASNDSLLQPTP